MKSLTFLFVLCLTASLAFGAVIDKKGTDVSIIPTHLQGSPATRADWVFNTGGAEDTVPTLRGTATGWGEWFITTVLNDTGEDLYLTEFGFPCSGPATEEFGWLVWVGVGGMNAPAGDAYSADFHGSFTPVEPDPGVDPFVYTYVDIADQNIVIPDGVYFAFGYDNTGLGGQVNANGNETWAWYNDMWDPDSGWNRTAVLQVKADFNGPVATESGSWSLVKSLYR